MPFNLEFNNSIHSLVSKSHISIFNQFSFCRVSFVMDIGEKLPIGRGCGVLGAAVATYPARLLSGAAVTADGAAAYKLSLSK